MLYKFNVTFPSGEVVTCDTFPLEPYSELLIAKSKGESVAPHLEKLLNEYTNVTSLRLNKQESEFVLIHLLNTSLNEDISPEVSKTCECGYKDELKLNLNHLSIADDDKLKNITFPKFSIKLRYPKIFEDNDMAKMITGCIEAVIVGDEVIDINDLSSIEVEDLYKAITYDHIVEMKELLLKPKLQLAVPYKCPECGKEEVFIINGLGELLELIL